MQASALERSRERVLARLISRLEERVMADPPPSQWQARKLAANIDYARALVFSAAVEPQDARKRIRALAERVSLLQHDDDDCSTDDDGEIHKHETRSSPTRTLASPPADVSALLDHHRAEQANLTDSLLHMSQQLKSNTVSFQSSLERDAELIDQAAHALERSTTNMKSAGRKLGAYSKQAGFSRWMTYGAWLAGVLALIIMLITMWLIK
ncbi:Protein transport protein use1 [Neolecta irregularis DAH-3]|uniref:Protein transport protein use1 n=1 Tax=Neolecta irregularis (strain DAH-3) TaxID=1198029 RepID=A0A1U7LIA7_NEOID|nr:Protein transport protein use1 [Neolecta irregularis DAH-3]|eukprot:OLL22282.1 Protein transport protein use1 [Neolecta irregularis DAH-3]